MKTLINLIITLFLLPGLLFGQTIKRLDGSSISAVKVDATVERLIKAGKIEGLSIALINNNKPVYVKAYGYQDKEKHLAMDTATVVYAASFSKAAFAYINMRLWQKGLIDLDKPLYQIIKKPLTAYGDYAELEKDPRWKKITPRMCLSHTAGLPNLWWLNVRTGERDTTLRTRIYFEPGSRYAYAGEGLKLLQRIEEDVFGRDLEQIAREELFVPAGMRRTSYLWQYEYEPNSALGYDEQGKSGGKLRSGKPGAAGSMLTTIADFGRFMCYVAQGKGLEPKYFNEMLKPQIRINSAYEFPTIMDETTHRDDKIKLSYGLGWGLLQTPYGKGFFKEGHHDFWRNYAICFPDKKVGIVIMCNSANGEGIFKELLERLMADKYTPWEWERYTPYDAAK